MLAVSVGAHVARGGFSQCPGRVWDYVRASGAVLARENVAVSGAMGLLGSASRACGLYSGTHSCFSGRGDELRVGIESDVERYCSGRHCQKPTSGRGLHCRCGQNALDCSAPESNPEAKG